MNLLLKLTILLLIVSSCSPEDNQSKHPNIIYMHECFGSWDYELNVEVRDPREVVRITQELYEAFGSVLNNIRVLSKFEDIKYTAYPVEQGELLAAAA